MTMEPRRIRVYCLGFQDPLAEQQQDARIIMPVTLHVHYTGIYVTVRDYGCAVRVQAGCLYRLYRYLYVGFWVTAQKP